MVFVILFTLAVFIAVAVDQFILARFIKLTLNGSMLRTIIFSVIAVLVFIFLRHFTAAIMHINN